MAIYFAAEPIESFCCCRTQICSLKNSKFAIAPSTTAHCSTSIIFTKLRSFYVFLLNSYYFLCSNLVNSFLFCIFLFLDFFFNNKLLNIILHIFFYRFVFIHFTFFKLKSLLCQFKYFPRFFIIFLFQLTRKI